MILLLGLIYLTGQLIMQHNLLLELLELLTWTLLETWIGFKASLSRSKIVT